MSRRDYNHENGICSPASYELIIEGLEGEIEELKEKLEKAILRIIEMTEDGCGKLHPDEERPIRQEYE